MLRMSRQRMTANRDSHNP